MRGHATCPPDARSVNAIIRRLNAINKPCIFVLDYIPLPAKTTNADHTDLVTDLLHDRMHAAPVLTDAGVLYTINYNL